MISTEASVGATRPISSSTRSIFGSLPMMLREVELRVELRAARRLGARRRASRPASAPSRPTAPRSAFDHGLVMKSAAPRFIPSTASSIEPHAVIRITGTSGCSARIAASSASPSSPVVRREKFMS